MAPRPQASPEDSRGTTTITALSLKICSTETASNTTFTRSCCPMSATCADRGRCALSLSSEDGNSTAATLYLQQVSCIVRQGDDSNSTASAVAASSSTSVVYPGSYPSVVSSPSGFFGYPNDSPPDDHSASTPLLFFYPLLILGFVAIAMGTVFMYYRRRKVRQRAEEDLGGGGENGPTNDSTVDLELPSYEQHSWNSRWAPYGRNSRNGDAGEILEVVHLRGDSGAVVPVAVIRNSMFCDGPEDTTPQTAEEPSKTWLHRARARAKLGRTNPGTAQSSEWSVQPPAYAARIESEAQGVKPPEPAVLA
jgi:hypothetical protein